MANKCCFEPSILCPFAECVGSSIESCNLRSGRFSHKSSCSGLINFGVLRGSRFVKLRGLVSF